MKNNFVIVLLVCFIFGNSFAQKITLNGYVKDTKTHEVLIGSNVFCTNFKTGTTTNEYGYYSITVPSSDTLGIVISYIGYKAQAKKIVGKNSLRLDILLEPNIS